VVTINVTDIAPLAKQTEIPIKAYNQVFTNLDLSQDATDADNDSLTVQITSGPTHGTLVLNSSTGLYDYTADSQYIGMDGLSFRYFDGVEYSQTVTVTILVYDASIDPLDPLIQNFEATDRAAPFSGAGGQPTLSSIEQGPISACWFVAPVISLVNQRPGDITGMIAPRAGSTVQFTVTFPGQRGIGATTLGMRAGDYSPANGDGPWLAVLEMAAGDYFYNGNPSRTGYDYINRGGEADEGIRLLTGHDATTFNFYNTRNFVVAAKLVQCFAAANNKIVCASTLWPNSATTGVVQRHVYSVTGFDAVNQMVHLFNPHGSNANFTVAGVVRNRNLTGGNFDMTLTEFTHLFYNMTFER
jgi:Bacterial Ig domain